MAELGAMAAHEHGFSTNEGNGRLILRSIHPNEVKQLFLIRSDPLNNKFHVVPDPNTGVNELLGLVDKGQRGHLKRFQLFIISKTEVRPPGKPDPFAVKGGTIVGFITLGLGFDPTPHNHHLRRADIGVIIHHEFAGKHYGKEAFLAVFDYVLLGEAKLWHLHGDTLYGLNLDQVFVDTLAQNSPFIGLMKSLGLEGLGKDSIIPQQGDRPEGEGRIWTIDKAEWANARRYVRMQWMPDDQSLARDASPTSLGSLEEAKTSALGRAPGSGHISGFGHPSSYGHAPGSGHTSGSGGK